MKKKFLCYLYFIKIKYFCGTINNSERIFNQLHWVKNICAISEEKKGKKSKKNIISGRNLRSVKFSSLWQRKHQSSRGYLRLI